MGCSQNVKVRLQAVRALIQIPRTGALWSQLNADAILQAMGPAITFTEDACGSSTPQASPAEERHLATYTKQLRRELCQLAVHWSSCTPTDMHVGTTELLKPMAL